MQKEPHGEEWRHLKEHSKVDRALSATVIIRFSSLTRCQGLVSRPMLKVKDTDSTIPKLKRISSGIVWNHLHQAVINTHGGRTAYLVTITELGHFQNPERQRQPSVTMTSGLTCVMNSIQTSK